MKPLRDLSPTPRPGSATGALDGVDERINALAASFADRLGDHALEVVTDQFDAAEGDVKQVWGRIMEWLLLQCEEQRILPAG